MTNTDGGLKVFDSHDTDLYASWHTSEGGTVTIYVPGEKAIIMSLAKAEDLAMQLARQAKYGEKGIMREAYLQKLESEAAEAKVTAETLFSPLIEKIPFVGSMTEVALVSIAAELRAKRLTDKFEKELNKYMSSI